MEAALSTHAVNHEVLSIARRQRALDRVFKYSTQFFALTVLLALLGIIASLIFNAAPHSVSLVLDFSPRLSGTLLMVSLVA